MVKMGVGRLNIGTGIGEADIIQGNPGLQALQQQMAQRAAQQQADQKAIVDQMGKLKPGELRNDADKQLYYKGYDDWRNSAINAQNERDTRKKMELQGQAQQKYNELQDLIDKSKQRGQLEHQLAGRFMDNNFSHQFKDDAVKSFLDSRNKAVTDPDLVDPNNLARQVDHTKVDAAFDKTNDLLLKNSAWSNPIQSVGKDKQGNKTGVVVHNERQVDPEKLIETGLHLYDASPDIQKSLEDRYGNIQGANPAETKALRVKQYYIDRGFITQGANGQIQTAVTESTKPEFKADYRPRVGPTNIYMPGVNTVQQIPIAKGKGVVQSDDYRGISIPNMNYAGSPAYDITNGSKVSALQSSGKYTTIGVGNFNFIKNGASKTQEGKQFEGTLAQPNFAANHPEMIEKRPMVHVQMDMPYGQKPKDFLIPYDKVPQNKFAAKPIQAALSGWQPAQQSQQPAKQSVIQKIKQAITPKSSGYSNVTDATDSNGNPIQLGRKNGKWYNVKTNKVVE